MASLTTWFSSLFRIARFWNLVIIAIAQYFTAIFLVNTELLYDWRMAALAISTMMIAAAGYIINDYYDVKIDLINKPERVVVGRSISRRYAILLHTILSITGVALGLLIDWKIAVVNFGSAFLLWLYSNSLKRLPFVGNFSVAVLTGLSVAVVWIIAVITPTARVVEPNWQIPFIGTVIVAQGVGIFVYSLFAFFVTLVREIIKDMEDLKGDNTFGCKTLPIVWGIRRTKNIIYFLTILFVGTVFFVHLTLSGLPMMYFTIFLFAPLAWLLMGLNRADTKKDYYQLSVLCKVIMVLGVFSMALL